MYTVRPRYCVFIAPCHPPRTAGSRRLRKENRTMPNSDCQTPPSVRVKSSPVTCNDSIEGTSRPAVGDGSEKTCHPFFRGSSRTTRPDVSGDCECHPRTVNFLRKKGAHPSWFLNEMVKKRSTTIVGSRV